MENKLTLSYDSYSDFLPYHYFIISYDTLPSSLKARFASRRFKQIGQEILDAIDLKHFDFVEVFKYWETDDTNDADAKDDYIHYYLFRSETKRLLFYIDVFKENTDIEFVYDSSDKEVENWVTGTNHFLRKKFGKNRTPKFKVLSYSRNRFSTEDIATIDFKSININEYYNDDFVDIDKLIVRSLKKTDSGLILLHGMPGTGKTSYIKHLISIFKDTEFIFIQNEFVKDLLRPTFVSFLLGHTNSVLIIEDAEKVILSRDGSSESSVVSTILQLTDGLFSDYLNIKIICTFNVGMEKIDKALLRKGRMMAKYKFDHLSSEKANALLTKLNLPQKDEKLTLADIFNFTEREFVNDKTQKIGF